MGENTDEPDKHASITETGGEGGYTYPTLPLSLWDDYPLTDEVNRKEIIGEYELTRSSTSIRG